MRIMGVAAIAAEPVSSELADAMHEGRPAFMWCDGDDVTAVIGEAGDGPGDVSRMVAQLRLWEEA